MTHTLNLTSIRRRLLEGCFSAILLAILFLGTYNPGRSYILHPLEAPPMTKKPARPVFQLYRYQILPLSQTFQRSFFDDRINSFEELVQKKNELFADAIKSIENWEYSKGEIIYRFEAEDEDFLIFRMGVLRKINLHTKEFSERETEDWPAIFIVINNDPKIQTAAVQLDSRVFQHTQTVARILEDNLNRLLRRNNLGVYFEPLFEKGNFWETVERYPNQIMKASFDLISPNMANISEGLKIDLGALHRSTNTKRTKLELNSDEGATLTLRRDDPTINSLVDYASEGGGTISIKIVGMKRTITTSDSIKETIIDEAIIKTDDPKLLAKQLEMLLE